MKKTMQWLLEAIQRLRITPLAPKTVTSVNRSMGKYPLPDSFSRHYYKGGHPQKPII